VVNGFGDLFDCCVVVVYCSCLSSLVLEIDEVCEWLDVGCLDLL